MTKPPGSIGLEYSLDAIRDASRARRRDVLLAAGPQIQAHYERLTEAAQYGLEAVDEETAAEALDLYNSVVVDGRFVDLLKEEPEAAARELGIEVSPEALGAISRINSELGGPIEGPVEAVIAVAVVIVLAPKIPAEGIVVDDAVVLRARL